MKQVSYLNPFGRFCCTIGNLPSSYMESLTYEQQLLWFLKFLDEKVIPAVNTNADAIVELQNYLKNLDLQEEVNNKLDEMAESGQLTDIIAQYLQLAGLLCYNTVADLKNAENLADGSFVKTFGYHSLNDGGGAFYKIREITNTDIINNYSCIPLRNENLVAILQNESLNVKMFGAVGDGITDDTTTLQNALNYASSNKKDLFFNSPINFYAISSGLIFPNGLKNVIFEEWNYYGVIRPIASDFTMITIKANMGLTVQNMSIGSDPKSTVNGLLIEGHIGLNTFKHIRVCNLNGFGVKINSMYDSLFEDFSVELCGNNNEYAFSINDDGDTTNMSVFDKLQVEQSNALAIFISPNTLNCTFTNIHSERTINPTANSYYFGGAGCNYLNGRINITSESDVAECCKIGGSGCTFTDFTFENYISIVYETFSRYLSFQNCLFDCKIAEKDGNLKKVSFFNCEFNELFVAEYTDCLNCKINKLYLNYMDSNYSIFNNCEITDIVIKSQLAVLDCFNCKITNLNAIALRELNLDKCIISSIVSSKIAYTTAKIKNCIFNTDLNTDGANLYINDSSINGNFINLYGNNVFSVKNVNVSGNIDARYSLIPTNAPTEKYLETYNLTPTVNTPLGWVWNGTNWLSMSNLI